MTPDLPHLYSGKVRDIYDAGDGRWLLGHIGPHLGVRRGDGRAHPRQGPGAHRHVGVLVRAVRRPVLQSPGLHRPGRLPARGAASPSWPGASMLVRKAEMLPIECIVRGYITGSAWKEYQRDGHHARRAAARRSARGVDSSRSRCSPRPPRPRTGPRREHLASRQAVDLVGAELAERARDLSLALYSQGAALAAERGIIIADTKFELGLVDGELVRGRRGAHPGLVPLLARRPVGARRHAAVVRQAAGARLPRRARLGQDPAAAAAARRRGRPPPAPATARPTSASPAGRSPSGPAPVAARPAERCGRVEPCDSMSLSRSISVRGSPTPRARRSNGPSPRSGSTA